MDCQGRSRGYVAHPPSIALKSSCLCSEQQQEPNRPAIPQQKCSPCLPVHPPIVSQPADAFSSRWPPVRQPADASTPLVWHSLVEPYSSAPRGHAVAHGSILPLGSPPCALQGLPFVSLQMPLLPMHWSAPLKLVWNGPACSLLPLAPPPVHTAGLAIFACVPTTLGVGQALVLTSRGNTAVALLLLVGTNLLGVASMPPMIKCESLGRRRAGSVPLGRVGTLVGSHGCRWQPEGLPAVATDGAMAAVSSLPECHLH